MGPQLSLFRAAGSNWHTACTVLDMDDIPELRCGSNWAQHEDCLVGNEVGLRRLQKACEVALREGEYFGNDLGEYVGVKLLDSSWFKNDRQHGPRPLGNLAVVSIVLVFTGLLFVGAATTLSWIVQLLQD